jgi:hypothetical protein
LEVFSGFRRGFNQLRPLPLTLVTVMTVAVVTVVATVPAVVTVVTGRQW